MMYATQDDNMICTRKAVAFVHLCVRLEIMEYHVFEEEESNLFQHDDDNEQFELVHILCSQLGPFQHERSLPACD